MELVLTPDNPVPPGVFVATVRAMDGLALRGARGHPAGFSEGTVVIATGRAEFIEKYFETVGELLARRLTVVVFDWRGQGLSARELDNARKGHIDDFTLYERDLEALVTQTLEPFCPKPWFALGHSMGGSILIQQARHNRSPFERIVAIAPLVAIYGLRFPGAARLLAEMLDIVGLGGAFIPGGGETSVQTKPFANNLLTSDPRRYARNAGVVAVAAQLGLGDPTVGWVNAAFRLMEDFSDPEYARRTSTPILVIAAGGDRVVDTGAAERFALRLKAGRLIVIPYAQHEVLMERDVYREQFWAAFDAFIPGNRSYALEPAHREINHQ
jgi:lysophospholipase